MYLGIDPGLKGALALYDPEAQFLEIHDMPTVKKRNGKDETAFAILGDLIAGGDAVRSVMLEFSSTRPGQGVVSAKSFGENVGAIKAAVAMAQLPISEVTPAAWKKYFKIPSGSNKDVSRGLAMQKFPKYAHLFARKKDDGRAEAALIALYASHIERRA